MFEKVLEFVSRSFLMFKNDQIKDNSLEELSEDLDIDADSVDENYLLPSIIVIMIFSIAFGIYSGYISANSYFGFEIGDFFSGLLKNTLLFSLSWFLLAVLLFVTTKLFGEKDDFICCLETVATISLYSFILAIVTFLLSFLEINFISSILISLATVLPYLIINRYVTEINNNTKNSFIITIIVVVTSTIIFNLLGVNPFVPIVHTFGIGDILGNIFN